MSTPNIELTSRDGGTGDAGDPYTGLDRFGRLVETLWRQAGSGEARVQSQYGRNEVGGVVWRKDEQAHAQDVPTEDNYFWYDALQQVKERQRGNLTGTAPDYTGIDNLQQEEDWAYDATGNWTSYSNPSPVPAHTQTRTQNTANEITEIARASGGATVEPSYDPAGNMLTLPKEPGISTDQYALKWDAWNRLVSVKDGSTNVASYTYDGLTRRLTKTNAAAETRHYFYNNQWRALEERVEGVSGVDRQYTWGLRDRWDLLRRKRSVSGLLDETLYILKDYLDPVAIVDDSGDVKERYSYDAFGNVRFLQPDYSDRSVSDYAWDFLFHGEFRDIDTQLYNYGYRYYSPALGRWPSRDPIGHRAGTNHYTFVSNRPIIGVDRFGLQIEQYTKDTSTLPVPSQGFDTGKGRNESGDCIPDWGFELEDLGNRLKIGGKLTLELKFFPIGGQKADEVFDRLGLNVGQHERTHAQIHKILYNQMADEVNGFEGVYPACSPCLELAFHLVQATYDFYAEISLYSNKSFDHVANPGDPAPNDAQVKEAQQKYVAATNKWKQSGCQKPKQR